MKELSLDIFQKIDKEKWSQLAEKQLKGGNPHEVLAWNNAAEFQLSAYYDQTDLEGLDYLTKFFSTISEHRWKLYERIDASRSSNVNKEILEALIGGCDGAILTLDNLNKIDVFLKDVDRTICDISIQSEQLLEVPDLSGMTLMPNGNCQVLGETANPIDQIIEALKESKPFIHRNAFPDFFLEIATLRALRFLLSEDGRMNTHVHTQVPEHQSSDHQWFLNTTSGLASILGGTHSIDFTTSTGDSRISRNIGNLIRDESGIETYTDQCGGSFYIEVLTDKIIKSVQKRSNNGE